MVRCSRGWMLLAGLDSVPELDSFDGVLKCLFQNTLADRADHEAEQPAPKRTAEFFLPTDDAKRPVSAAKNIQSFYAGLDTLGVVYQQIKVPYGEGHHLEAVYYPAAEDGPRRPLIVLGGGYDSTLEELYFVVVKDAHEHGFAVLTYDGPGQGSVLRDQGLIFTHEWEKWSAPLELDKIRRRF